MAKSRSELIAEVRQSIRVGAAELMAERFAVALPQISDVRQQWPEHVARYERAARVLGQLPPGPIVDAASGCGYGAAILAEMLPEAPTIWALEGNCTLLAYAELHYKDPRILWRHRNLSKSWLLHEVLGTVAGFVCAEMIEYLADPTHLLRQAGSLLRPDGRLIITTPHVPQGSPHHAHEYELGELEELLEAEGFEILDEQEQRGIEFVPLDRTADLRGRYMFLVATRSKP